MHSLPIESAFLKACKEKREYLEYYSVYMATKYILQNHYYPYIKDVNPFFTDHGINHINRILAKLNDLLQPHLLNTDIIAPQSRQTISADLLSKQLNVYELYLLLCSVIWHDVGNLWGRTDHHQKIFKLFKKAKDFLHDKKTSEWIQTICRAHSGDKAIDIIDTDSIYEKEFQFYPRFLAALLRFCDELDESKERIEEHIYATVPKHSKAYWFFCKCNDSIHIERDSQDNVRIAIVASIDKSDLYKIFTKKVKSKLVKVCGINEYITRINKINVERIYCNKFYQPHYFKKIDMIALRLRIYDNDALLNEIQFNFDDQNGEKEFFARNQTHIDIYR